MVSLSPSDMPVKHRKVSRIRRISRVILFLFVPVSITITLISAVQLHSEGGRGGDSGLHVLISIPLLHEGSSASHKLASETHADARHTEDLGDREPIFQILRQADYDLNDLDVFRNETLAALPTWVAVMESYGPPRVVGLETCSTYREQTKPAARELAVAGTFNSGTNILHDLLQLNCNFPSREPGKGIEWQVPWGKHMPASQRLQHTSKKGRGKDHSQVLPIVSVRDPYTWMQSMCRQPYAVRFDHSTDRDLNLCPNIVPYEEDIKNHPRYGKMKYMPAFTKYLPGFEKKYTSIAHLWNEWYQEYLNHTIVDFPRILVRMEDLVFHAEAVVPQMCECAGGTFRGPFRHHSEVSNQNIGIDIHSSGSGLLRSIIRYGNQTERRKGYQSIQIQAAKEVLDPELMDLFGYSYLEPYYS